MFVSVALSIRDILGHAGDQFGLRVHGVPQGLEELQPCGDGVSAHGQQFGHADVACFLAFLHFRQ